MSTAVWTTLSMTIAVLLLMLIALGTILGVAGFVAAALIFFTVPVLAVAVFVPMFARWALR